MLLALASDFVDYYDDEFDVVSNIPHRKLTRKSARVPREEMLEYLSENTNSLLFQRVVPHGKTLNFNKGTLVVYVDDFAANGLGMEQMEAHEAHIKYPDSYATLFLDNRGCSLKHVVVGKQNFLISVCSGNSWKSNTGRVKRKTLHVWEDRPHPVFPLYTVTYINHDGKPAALRMNFAPKLENLINLPKADVVKELKGWFT